MRTQLAALLTVAIVPLITTESTPPRARTLQPLTALPNHNRVSVGRLIGDVFSLRLEAREVAWRPEGSTGPAIPVFAFAEAGRAASVPEPLIRVAAGTELHVAVHNNLSKPVTLRGVRPSSCCASVRSS